jgi:hypothetical protein
VTAHDELLKRFQPHLRYDSNEQFFADSAAQYTEGPGIELRRGPVGDKAGSVIARAVPRGGEPKLTLAFLGPKTYGDGRTVVQATDVISVRGKDYRTQYVRLRTERPDLNNRMYGRAIEVDGRLWLQYWLWYFYNDYQLALGAGRHEGDWEMVQLRIHEGRPDVAVYAQHRHGEKRPWGEVEKLASDPDKPVVYVSRGSHASYFEPGFHETEAWYDLADGKRPAPALALEIVSAATHPWLRWPGRWGDTVAQDRSGVQADSPTGPGRKKQWSDPQALLDDATVSKRREPPPAPDVIAARAGRKLRVDYDVAAREPTPHTLVVTVNSRNEKGVPPRTHTFPVAAGGKGTVTTGVELDPAKHYDVYTSTVAGDPPLPSESTYVEIDAAAPAGKMALPTRIVRFVSRRVAQIRRHR